MNNQQMQLYAVNFIPLLGSLSMFRVFYTPIIRSTILKTTSPSTLTAVGIRCADHVTPLYPQKLALTSPTCGSRSVGIVRSRTKATEFSLV